MGDNRVEGAGVQLLVVVEPLEVPSPASLTVKPPTVEEVVQIPEIWVRVPSLFLTKTLVAKGTTVRETVFGLNPLRVKVRE